MLISSRAPDSLHTDENPHVHRLALQASVVGVERAPVPTTFTGNNSFMYITCRSVPGVGERRRQVSHEQVLADDGP